MRKGLEQTGGNYQRADRAVQHAGDRLQALPQLPAKHHCHVAFQQFRTVPGRPINMTPEESPPASEGPRRTSWIGKNGSGLTPRLERRVLSLRGYGPVQAICPSSISAVTGFSI